MKRNGTLRTAERVFAAEWLVVTSQVLLKTKIKSKKIYNFEAKDQQKHIKLFKNEHNALFGFICASHVLPE